MNYRCVCSVGLLLTLAACAPQPKKELSDDEIDKIEYVRIREQQALDKATAEGSIEWLNWLCALPEGPEREAAKQKTIDEYGMQPICAGTSAKPPATATPPAQ